MNRACIRQKCQDPCPGTCGLEALCSITNHIPICTCPHGTTGDAFRQCIIVVERGNYLIFKNSFETFLKRFKFTQMNHFIHVTHATHHHVLSTQFVEHLDQMLFVNVCQDIMVAHLILAVIQNAL